MKIKLSNMHIITIESAIIAIDTGLSLFQCYAIRIDSPDSDDPESSLQT